MSGFSGSLHSTLACVVISDGVGDSGHASSSMVTEIVCPWRNITLSYVLCVRLALGIPRRTSIVCAEIIVSWWWGHGFLVAVAMTAR